MSERILGGEDCLGFGAAVALRSARAGFVAARRARLADSAATIPRGSAGVVRGRADLPARFGRGARPGRAAAAFGFAGALGFARGFGFADFGGVPDDGLRGGDGGEAAARAEARRLPAAVDAR